jgi:integrase/recombinase XerD
VEWLQTVAPALSRANSDDQAISLWLKSVSPGSKRVYAAVVREFRSAVPAPLAHVRLEDLAGWFESLGGAANTRRRKQATVKSLLSYCHRIGYLPFDVGGPLAARGFREVEVGRILSRDEVLRIIEAAEGRGREVLEFLYESGVRAGELSGLLWRDLRPHAGGLGLATVRGKAGRTRGIVLSAGLFAWLDSRRGSGESFVFTGPRGGRLEQPDLWRLVRRAAAKAGVESAVSPHWFRHACASHAIDAGAPLHLVQQQLGHSSLAVTGLYLHAKPQDGLFRFLERSAES